jgi:hypothetical protein
MKQAIRYAIVYVGCSIAFELVLIVVGGFRVPQDTATLGPLIISIPPFVLALLFGRQSLKRFVVLFLATSIFTLVLTLTFIAITGIATGFVEPVINRGLAGILAYLLTDRIATKTNSK